MPSANITALTNYAGGQSPADLMYIGKSPFGVTDDRKSTLNDLFETITKNITEKAVIFQEADSVRTVSAVNTGKLSYSVTSQSFQVSENGGAYQNLVKGVGANTRVAFWTDTDTLSSDSAFLWDSTNDRLLINVAVASGAAPLDILADGSAVAQQWRQNAGAARVQVRVPSSYGEIGTTTTHDFAILTNNLQRLNIESSGAAVFGSIVPATGQVMVNSLTTNTIALIANNAAATSVDIARFQVNSSNRFVFTNAGEMVVGLASTIDGKITLASAGAAFTQSLMAGTAPAATNAFRWPNADPSAGQALTASAPAAGVVTLSWTTVGGATINPTDTLIPYRSSSTAFSDSNLVRLSTTITDLRDIATGTNAQSFRVYGTSDNGASDPTNYVRALLSSNTTSITLAAQSGGTGSPDLNINLTPSGTGILAVSGQSLTGTSANSALTISTTWNTTGTPSAIFANITDTASNASSQVLEIQRSGSFTFKVSKSGVVALNGFTGLSVPTLQAWFNNSTVLSIAMSTSGSDGQIDIANKAGATTFEGASLRFLVGATPTINSPVAGRPLIFQAQSTEYLRITATTGVVHVRNNTSVGNLLIGSSTDSVTGNFTVMSSNAATNSIVTVARLGVNSTGTAADGFGASLSFSAESSTTNDSETARVNAFWTTATHANRTAALSWSLTNLGTVTEFMRLSVAALSSPVVLAVHGGTNPNVWTSGSFAPKLYLIGASLPAVGVAAHFSATALDAPQWQMLRGRGTNASPTAIQASDSIGNIEWWGQTSTSTNNVVAGARIRVSATENWSAGNNGCQMIFFVSNNASTITEVASIQPTGCFRIGATAGSTSTDTKLQIGGYASWNLDVVGAIYTGADDNKGLEIIGTNGQTADLFRCFLDGVTPDKLNLTATGRLTTHWLNWNGEARVSTQFDKTTDTTLANVTGLSITVVAGRTYSFKAVLYTTSAATGGVKAAIAGTATATAIRYEAIVFDAAAVAAQTRATALGTAVGGVTVVTAAIIIITGTITVNAGGTLTVQFAQNASDGTASSVLTGSTFIADDVP